MDFTFTEEQSLMADSLRKAYEDAQSRFFPMLILIFNNTFG